MTDNDDLPVGRVLTRREALKLMAGVTVALLVGCRITDQPDSSAPATVVGSAAGAAATPTAAGAVTASTAASSPASALPACIVRPEMTDGPFFADEQLNRSDVRSDSATGARSSGAPLLLTFMVSQISSAVCAPLADAVVDIWHCDAAGVYSEFGDGAGSDFLRGYQQTDASGRATFTTIYPGWYPGRTVHIHFKIRVPTGGNTYDFTSQLFFDDAVTDEVYMLAPYTERPGRTTLNVNDGLYRDGGDQLLLAVTRQGEQYVAAFDIGLDLT